MEVAEASKWIAFDHSADPPKPKVVTGAPEGVVDVVKANRDECLRLARDRYLEVPPAGFPFRLLPSPTRRHHVRLARYVNAQREMKTELDAWFDARTDVHVQAKATEPWLNAVMDLIGWQQSHRADPAQFIVDLE